jgi:dipeptidyl aminopeptidase/acylaminoacyl peptidase
VPVPERAARRPPSAIMAAMRSLPLLLVLSLSCAAPQAAAPAAPAPPITPAGESSVAAPAEPGVVRFFDRRVDLKPFLSGFPYSHFVSQLDDGKLYYLDTRERYTLLSLAVSPASSPLELPAGVAVADADFSQRSLWNVHYEKARGGELWLHADEHNDERMNLFRIAPGTKTPVAETDADYIYDFGFSEDGSLLAYLPRTGKQAPFSTCLRVRNFAAEQPGGPKVEREVLCDDAKLRFTWGRILFSPDEREGYFAAQSDDDRNRVQLVRVDLTAKKPKLELVTDPRRSRSSPDLLDGWVNGERLVFIANDDGYRNLYAYSRKTRKVEQLTRFGDDIDDAELALGGVFLSHGTPAASTLELVDAVTGKARASSKVPGKVDVLDGDDQRVLWTHDAPDVMFELNETRLAANGEAFDKRTLARPEPQLEAAVVQCKAEAVQIPTFDVDPKTGQKRLLHAFLLTPKQPLAPADHVPGQLALIRSFYGGENIYSQYDHILCAAGLTVLSPAVRGSSGFGKEFFALNDGDLGGDEIIDLFYAARWLETRTGLSSQRIGVYGRSHGGYATMRALTFPPSTNQRNESYAFGFGLAEAGFSDIEAFYRACNIPDWVVLEAGDPQKPDELAQIRDRSPIHHVALLNAPLFLMHGEKDWRVPVEGSRAFASAAAALGKPVTYLEMKGQGHRVEGLERIAETWEARLDFLETLFQRTASTR